MRLKNRHEAPIGGFVFIDSQINSQPITDWGFVSLVNTVIQNRSNNPRFGLSTDFNTVANEVDKQNAQRMSTIRGGANYILQAPPPPAPTYSPGTNSEFWPSTPLMTPEQIAQWLGRPVIGPMKNPIIVMVYIYAEGGANGWKERADAFVDSYVANPPGYRHKTVVICNGHRANGATMGTFSRLYAPLFLEHDDSGFDIGGYQKAAAEIPADIMLFCGGHTYFRHPNWMNRMVETYYHFGETLYGSMGDAGNQQFNIYPHIRTTGFWCSPVLINKYPHKVTEHGGGGPGSKRYFFEHGSDSLTMWARRQGFQPQIICSHGSFPMPHCHLPETYRRDNQSGLLMGDKLSKPPHYHCS